MAQKTPPIKKHSLWTAVVAFSVVLWMGLYIFFIFKDLPPAYSLNDYKPPLLSVVYDRNGRLIGEFFKQRRMLTPYSEFPEFLIQAFISAEDGNFFKHKGINLKSIFRAFLANLKAGKKVQGGSTITQQTARSLLLSSQKTYTRKLKEAILALRMEKHLTKSEILYLYLNQIYLGHGAYGVGMASKIYFKKEVKNLTLEEAALLAGLPQAPSRFSPISNAKKAKERQIYVLNRMAQENYISSEQALEAKKKPVAVYMRENYSSRAPYFVETLRQILLDELGEKTLLEGGLIIETSLDLDIQKAANQQIKKGLKDLDKRQGYRGPLKNLSDQEAAAFLISQGEKWTSKKKNRRLLMENGEDGVLNSHYEALSSGDTIQGVVQTVEKDHALVDLMFSLKGLIPLQTTKWARVPNKKTDSRWSQIDSLHSVLKKGDVIWVQMKDPEEHKKIKDQFADLLKTHRLVSLEQEPLAQGALISFDQKSQGVIAMVGGYDFSKSQFNRSWQAKRQTGSVFKPIIYASALDKGLTPRSIISDEPVVYKDEEADLLLQEDSSEDKDSPPALEKWKPMNYSKQFTGDTLFRNALIRSLNIPTVKLIEKIGIPWIEFYARRLDITSSLNADYTLALGSSSVTLYEMTKAFSIFGRNGRRTRPILAKKITTPKNEVLLSNIGLDKKFEEELKNFREEFEKSWDIYWEEKTSAGPQEKSNIFFKDKDQIIPPETAYLMTSLLKGVIFDPSGTGRAAQSLQRPIAGKTGTTNGYYDSWFIGYSPEIIAGVWIGFDSQESLGQSETGSRAALPVWRDFMKAALKDQEIKEFEIPEGIVFANIDNESGYLARADSKEVARQAFLEGTEPKQQRETLTDSEDQNFLREDLAL